MTSQRLNQILPRASSETIRLNTFDNSESSDSDIKSGVRSRTLAKSKTQESNSSKCLVSIVSYRFRLADADACCGKWHLDALRMAGVIRDDTTEDIEYKISQKKVSKKEEQKTLIQITYPNE